VSPIQVGDHFVLRQLSIQLLPWMICGRRLRRLPIVYLAIFWEYTSDLAAALAGLGIGTPMVALISGKAPEGKTALDALREVLPGWWLCVGVAALIAWLVLRLVIQTQTLLSAHDLPATVQRA
jgi:hypothetical protein